MKIALVFLFSMIPLGLTQELRENPLSSEGLLEEAMSVVENPHAFDWRRSSMEIEAAYDYVDEKNNFNNDGGHIGLGFPVGSGFVVRTLVRRIVVYPTSSSDKVARTPFKQAGGKTRFEYMLGGGWSFLEGRSFTRLSPWIPDLQNALQFTFGTHYSHANASWIPKKQDEPDDLPGQRGVNSKFVLELGVRWQIYFPNSLGIFYEIGRHLPLDWDSELRSWNVMSGGVSWAFGSH